MAKKFCCQEISKKVTPGFPLTGYGRLFHSKQILRCHPYTPFRVRAGRGWVCLNGESGHSDCHYHDDHWEYQSV